MGSIAVGERNKILDAFARNVAYQNAAIWVKLHTADPGAAGTTAPAANTTRVLGTFGTGASAGAISNTTLTEWTNVPTAETYTHVSLWSASTAGTFLGSDDLSAPAAVAVGDTFQLPIGQISVTLA